MHLGGVRFPVTGPLRYTMTGAEAAELCEILRPRTVVPIHYEGWQHFHEGRAAAESAFAASGGHDVRWLEPGVAAELAA